ncbi:MAG: nucleotidyltransferase family protein [Oscillospiraceae bacterium]|nr:nucleotidyltransferase family protein [Oscillospiraceae bacterium]
MGEEMMLFALIRAAISGVQPEDNIRVACTPEILEAVYALAVQHDLAHLVGQAVSGLELPECPALTKCKQKAMQAAYRYGKAVSACESIYKALEMAQTPFIPLKGTVLRDYYPHPWMRTSCDIDILVHEDDSEKAMQALCNAGFVRQSDCTTYDYSLISPGGVRLELHYSLAAENKLPGTDVLLKRVWEYASAENAGRYRYNMTNEVFVFYHIVHMAKHFFEGGCGIRPFLDLWLLKKKMQWDPEKLCVLFEKAKLIEFYKAVSVLCDVWFEGIAHNSMTKQMENYILTGGVYGNTANSAVVKAARGESKIRSFMKLMFLPRANMEVLYPNLKKHPALFPFYQIKRWCRVLQKDKRRKMQRLVTARNSVLQDEAGTVNNLLKQLGLIG